MDFFMDFYTNTLKDLDFWFVELIVIAVIYSKLFKFNIYRHQKYAILFNLSLSITKIIAIILSFCDENHNDYLWYSDKLPFLKIIIGIIIYLVLITIRSYINSKIKVYMDLKYISANKLLIFYGFFGTITYTIICLISTFIECRPSSIFSKPNSTSNLNYICNVPFKYYFNDSQVILADNKTKYLDNFEIYFKTFQSSSSWEIFKEIIIIFFAGITYFYYKYFCLLMIKFLSPIHYIFSNEIYFSLKKIVLPINTAIYEGSFFVEGHIEYITGKFILDTTGDYLSLLGFLVFLEIIELNFYDLNKNLRRKIMDRSVEESINLLEDNFPHDDDDDDDDDNKEDRKTN